MPIKLLLCKSFADNDITRSGPTGLRYTKNAWSLIWCPWNLVICNRFYQSLNTLSVCRNFWFCYLSQCIYWSMYKYSTPAPTPPPPPPKALYVNISVKLIAYFCILQNHVFISVNHFYICRASPTSAKTEEISLIPSPNENNDSYPSIPPPAIRFLTPLDNRC